MLCRTTHKNSCKCQTAATPKPQTSQTNSIPPLSKKQISSDAHHHGNSRREPNLTCHSASMTDTLLVSSVTASLHMPIQMDNWQKQQNDERGHRTHDKKRYFSLNNKLLRHRIIESTLSSEPPQCKQLHKVSGLHLHLEVIE